MYHDRYNGTILIIQSFTHRPNSIVESNTDSKVKLRSNNAISVRKMFHKWQ